MAGASSAQAGHKRGTSDAGFATPASACPPPALPAGDKSLRIALAYNPEAGRFSMPRLTRLRDRLERAGHRVTVENSLAFGASGRSEPIDVACLFGGDGTARSVISRAGQSRPEGDAGPDYCVYPAGTVNLIARETGYSRNVSAFVRRLSEQAKATAHFCGQVDGETFLCCASVGPDSAVVANVTPALKRRFGRLAYVIALTRLIRRWPRQRMTVTVDGREFSAEAVYVCKGRHYAGPWTLDDAADLRADHFRVLLLDRARRRDVVRLALSALVSRKLGDPHWHRLSARSVEISAPTTLPVQADGDILASTPTRLSIAPHPLRFR